MGGGPKLELAFTTGLELAGNFGGSPKLGGYPRLGGWPRLGG